MKKNTFVFLILLLQGISLQAHDILLEAKTALFLPTGTNFKNIYGKTGGIYGLELTGKLKGNWYGFLSADFFNKHGNTLIFDTYTNVKIENIGIGLKYFMPLNCGDLYLGVGALPTRLHTFDDSQFVPKIHDKWTCGGIAKLGMVFDVTQHLFVDLFFDYNFTKVNFKFIPNQPTQLHNAKLNSFWLGLGLGCRL